MGFSVNIQHLLPEWLLAEAPQETYATCSNCVMQCKKSTTARRDMYYGESKCCTYQPNLSNYAVGSLLDDTSTSMAEGQQRIRNQIDARLGVYPIGIKRSRRYDLLYESSSNWFGRAQSMVCPYYSRPTGSCTIWPHRNPVCTTWFCVHEHGHDGSLFWSSVRGYLEWLDRLLSAYTLSVLGWDSSEIFSVMSVDDAPLTDRDLDERPLPDVQYRSIWRQWVGREMQLYCATSEIVRSLSRSDIRDLGGFEHDLHSKNIEDRVSNIKKMVPPEYLVYNQSTVVVRTLNDTLVLGTCGNRYLTTIPADVYASLGLFDGTLRIAEGIRAAKERHAVAISTQLLLQLFHQRVLLQSAETYWESIERDNSNSPPIPGSRPR